MMNCTKDGVIFNQLGSELELSARQALDLSATWVLKCFGMESVNLDTVTTKTNLSAAYPALVRLQLLELPVGAIGEDYIRNAMKVYTLPFRGIPPEYFSSITLADDSGRWAYKASYGARFRRGIGTFLVALHASGAITLPFSFDWPRGHVGNGPEVELCDLGALPELLSLIRSIEFEANTRNDPVFDAFTPVQRKHLWTYGTKLMLCLGWREPSDVSLDDLVKLKRENDDTDFAGPNIFNQVVPLLDVLERKYKGRAAVTVSEWRAVSKSLRTTRMSSLDRAAPRGIPGDEELAEVASQVQPASFAPSMLSKIRSLPGLDSDITALHGTWRVLEESFLKKTQRENYKQIKGTFGYFNIYLFYYLPYWYARHPDCEVAFPDVPNKLLSSVFIADLGLPQPGVRPMTLLDYFRFCSEKKEWRGESQYAHLIVLKRFFEYLERHSAELPGCVGFKQPLSTEDFPATSRAMGTNKRPIPRRVFPLFVAYAEAIAALSEALLERILAGEVTDADLDGIATYAVTDTFAWQHVFGFIPMVFHQGKGYPLRYIPSVLQLNRMRVKGGRVLRIPQPHALHQIIVALHTGIRHNHIQWLDLQTFDKYHIDEASQEFTRLYVNTDKVKTAGWSPYVHLRVIEILGKQKRWRELIDEAGFGKKVFYNGNERTKWGSFYPLFSSLLDGMPHPDNRYHSVWRSLVAGVQSLLGDIGDRTFELYRLLPPGISIDDPNLDRKLHEYGAEQKNVCELEVKTRITPHSARVSVVSHSITVLPADVIGKYITGQKESTVYHYVALDDEEVFAEQQLQKIALRDRGYKNGYEGMLSAVPADQTQFIRADDVNSSLVGGLRGNLEETIASHGLTSFTLNDAIKTGIEVLRETGAQGAVFNKTEICPYGNRCPGELVKQIGAAGRCSLCPYAVRSIDHLPAVTAKYRQVGEMLHDVEDRINDESGASLTLDEYDSLGHERARLAEDLAAWRLVEEVLEITRQRIEAGASNARWVVQKPEIVELHLKKARFPSQETEYVLARLIESESYPTLESPQIRAKFDLMRRQLLANMGDVRKAISSQIPVNPAAECLGLIRSVVSANKLTNRDVLALLKSDEHLESHPHSAIKLLTGDQR